MEPNSSRRGAALRALDRAASAEALEEMLVVREIEPATGPGEAVIEVHAAGVNPSDVKAVLGAMPAAVWPRTPGRDYAGVVVDGPAALLGTEVWGSGGELGIRRDGSHARYLVVKEGAVRAKPGGISLAEAGGAGVPFITAWTGWSEAGGVSRGDRVLVLGANGSVGQAAIQLATIFTGAGLVLGVERRLEAYRGHAAGPVRMLDPEAGDLAEQVREATDGHGADLIYNTVGSPYFKAANRSLALGGRQIFISTVERTVSFDLFAFYRGRHRFFGIDTLAMDSLRCATILDRLRPDFETGALRPFPIQEANLYPLARAADAYRAVLAGSGGRVVLEPGR